MDTIVGAWPTTVTARKAVASDIITSLGGTPPAKSKNFCVDAIESTMACLTAHNAAAKKVQKCFRPSKTINVDASIAATVKHYVAHGKLSKLDRTWIAAEGRPEDVFSLSDVKKKRMPAEARDAMWRAVAACIAADKKGYKPLGICSARMENGALVADVDGAISVVTPHARLQGHPADVTIVVSPPKECNVYDFGPCEKGSVKAKLMDALTQTTPWLTEIDAKKAEIKAARAQKRPRDKKGSAPAAKKSRK
jgi:hypothetical protein